MNRKLPATTTISLLGLAPGFQLTGGQTWDKLDITYRLQYSKQKPIWGYQRHWYDSTEDNPDPTQRYGSLTFLILDAFTNTYFDSGAACDDLAGNFGGNTIRDFRPGRDGHVRRWTIARPPQRPQSGRPGA